MFTIFFGGLSFHLTCAILAHLFSINMVCTLSTTSSLRKKKANQ